MNYVQRRHSVTCLQSHLVFTTKYRRKIFLDEHIEQLRWAFGLACQKLEIDLQEFDGDLDHVHLLIQYPPKLSISVIVNSLKATSSRRFKAMNHGYGRLGKNGALWSRSYFAANVGGAPMADLKKYIQNQKAS